MLPPEDYILLYLTLNDGNSPSEYSTGSGQLEYYCISYRTHVLNWLEKSVELASRYPLIRETIQQYIINLKSILNIMENNDMKKYMEILTSEENILTTVGILEQGWSIQCKIREKFIGQIKEFCCKNGFQCEFDNEIINCANNSWIRIWDNRYSGVFFRIGVVSHAARDGFRMDFIIPSTKKVTDQFEYIFWPEGNKRSNVNPLGWTYLWSESGKPESGKWWRWDAKDNWNTLRDMVNGKMFGFICKTLCQIKEQDVFRIISEALIDNACSNT